MKLVLWVCNQSNQIALANKLHEKFELKGIVFESKKLKRRYSFIVTIDKIIERLLIPSISRAWFKLLNYYSLNYPKYPSVSFITVSNINMQDTVDFTKKINPDFVLVSGTSLIKSTILNKLSEFKILNLHTGLSPHIKGGPNCTNWCIALKQFHLIGNTIMWIDAGIDTGKIITSEFTALNGNEDFFTVHLKVMEHAHELYVNAVAALQKKHINGVFQNEIGSGKTFYNKDWTLKNKIKLVINFKFYYKRDFKRSDNLKNNIKTIDLP